jgi:formylglycine-generating enzyme required for sulfatase activity
MIGRYQILFCFSFLFVAMAHIGFAQNEVVYHETAFEAATSGVGQLHGFEGWIATDSLANGIIDEGIIGQGQAAYVGFLIGEGKTVATVFRTFSSQYPQSGRPVYTVDLDFVLMDSTNGQRDFFLIEIAGANNQLLASLFFDNLSKSILSRSAATGTYVSTGFTFSNGIPGKLEFHLDLAADTWSAVLGGATLVDQAPLVGTSGLSPVPTQFRLAWVLRDGSAPGNNYLIFDNVRIAADPGPYVFIQQQPASQGVLPGETAQLSVQATGEGPLQYQWYVGRSGDVDEPVPGANGSEFETPPIDNPSEFWVRVSNGLGYVDSATTLITPRRNPPLTIETIEVGYPGNFPDGESGPGAVDYNYHIGKYPVTNEEYAAFLNAVASDDDPFGLYDERMGTEVHGGIERLGAEGEYSYEIRTASTGFNEGKSMAHMPVTYVSYWSAARFANWLTSGDTETGLYPFNGIAQPASAAITRDQTLFLNGGVAVANENEWYKAAFHNPTLTVNPTFGNWGYRTYSNNTGNSNASADFENQVALNYANVIGTVTPVGAYVNSASYYGTFDQSGNVFEWLDDVVGSERRKRGGAYDSGTVTKSVNGQALPVESFGNTGFRLTSGTEIIRRAVFSLDVTGTGEGEIFIDGQEVQEFPIATIYQHGTSIQLTAIPSFGSTFPGWFGDVEDGAQTITVILDQDTTIQARFDPMSGPPIIDQPQSRTIGPGDGVTLSVNAAGNSLSYQWYEGPSGDTSAPISGATDNELILEDFAETANFWVRVTAIDGEFTDSETATITITARVGLNEWDVVPSNVSNALYAVTWGGGQFVAVGSGGAVLTSADGSSWQARNSGTTWNLLGVAWNGGQYVAVGAGGIILTSADAVSWVPRASGSTAQLNAVTSGSSGFVAVGSGGTILTSTNGASWTQRTSPLGGVLEDVIWNGSAYLAVGQTSSSQFGGQTGTYLRSTNGVSWTTQTIPIEHYTTIAARSFSDIVVARNGGAVRHSLYSTSNWDFWDTGVSANYHGSLWSGREYIMVGTGAAIVSSPDGIRWQRHQVSGPPNVTFRGIAKNEDVIVVVGFGGHIRVSTISPSNPPRIQVDPASQTVAPGASVTLSVTALGHGLVYQWYEGLRGDTSRPVFGADGPLIGTLPVVEESRYWVRITDSVGFYADSEVAVLTPLLEDRPYAWKWQNPLPSGITLNDLIHTSDGFVAVGNQGKVAISANGSDWEIVDSFVPEDLNAIVWTGSQYLAVGNSGVILSSQNARQWQQRFSRTTHNLQTVVWDGLRFVAAGNGSVIIVSDDGVSWNRVASSGLTVFNGIASNGEILVMVGSGGSIRTSTNGISWFSRNADTWRAFEDVIWDGQQFIAVGGGGMVATSEDGITWAIESVGLNHGLRKIRQSGEGYVMISFQQEIWESADATTWSVIVGEESGVGYHGVAFGGGTGMIVGRGTMLLKANGESWTSGREGPALWLRDIASSEVRMVAVTNNAKIITSSGLGAPWEVVHTSEQSNWFSAIDHGPHGFVAVGSGGGIARSSDGIVWNESLHPSGQALSHVHWTGSGYLASGTNGTILTSADGLQWVARDSGVSVNLVSGASSENLHVLVGSGGTVITSSNLIDWTPAALPQAASSYSLQGIVYSGSGFLAFATQSFSSAGGTNYNFLAIASLDGLEWQTIPGFNNTNGIIKDLQWNGERFMAVGNNGEVWTSETGLTWQRQKSADGSLEAATVFDGHWVVVGNYSGLIQSAPDAPAADPVEIFSQPTAARAAEGATVELSVLAIGHNWRYQWYRGSPGDVSQPVGGEFANTLSVPVSETPETYWVRVSRGYGAWADSDAATVSLLPEIPTFAEWTGEGGLVGADAAAEATPHGDGVSNLLKYAFNLNPAAADSRTLSAGGSETSGLPAKSVTVDGGSIAITIEYLRRRDSGLIYTPVVSSDLVNWAPIFAPETVTLIDDEWERVTVTHPVDATAVTRLFGAVEVRLPESSD